MHSYTAPLQDMQFLLFDVLKVQEQGNAIPAYAEATADVVSAILEEGGKFCGQVLHSINRSGDEEGCSFDNGKVKTAAGFKEAYDKFIAGGWNGVGCDPAFGGQGLITPVTFLFEEMMCACNLSFGLFPGLTRGAYGALVVHGTEAQKNTYLPKMVAGTWSGTMNLTEPQCGTDLGLLKTRAEPQADGSFKLFGTKIFISAGEHDLTENIIHLVLARLPDAPAGVKGISLFLCPKVLVNDDGALGARNAVTCGALEKKMGIKASPTCVMNYDGATAWLVGQPNKGLSAMFTMMNGERLAVGVQGLGIADMAYQGAADYAKNRVQMRSATGTKYPDKVADPIIVHADVRRMLLRMRSLTEGCRALALWIGQELDISMLHPDPERRREADDLVALMTPVVKAMLTDQGFAAANDAVQIHGGHGFIREWGMEQLVRDARITQIYEGTNGIQAIDLVGRKLTLNMGRLVRRFFHPVQAYIDRQLAQPAPAATIAPLASAFAQLQETTLWLNKVGASNPEDRLAGATDYLRMFGLVAIGYLWARMAQEANTLRVARADPFYDTKIMTAHFYMTKILPETSSLMASIMAGGGPVMALPEDAF